MSEKNKTNTALNNVIKLSYPMLIGTGWISLMISIFIFPNELGIIISVIILITGIAGVIYKESGYYKRKTAINSFYGGWRKMELPVKQFRKILRMTSLNALFTYGDIDRMNQVNLIRKLAKR